MVQNEVFLYGNDVSCFIECNTRQLQGLQPSHLLNLESYLYWYRYTLIKTNSWVTLIRCLATTYLLKYLFKFHYVLRNVIANKNAAKLFTSGFIMKLHMYSKQQQKIV